MVNLSDHLIMKTYHNPAGKALRNLDFGIKWRPGVNASWSDLIGRLSP